jgi:hypothetical protein
MARVPRKLAGIGAADLANAAVFDAYVGPAREVTVDQMRGILALHDGVTPGGLQFTRGGGGGSGFEFVGGRLSLVSGDPVPEADVVGATSIYLIPALNNQTSLYNGSAWTQYTFDQLALTLVAAHAAGNNYDIWEFLDAGVVKIGSGPSWIAGDTAGSATSRGQGVGSTEVELFQGRIVNKNSMTVRNGSSTFTVAARRGRLRGSFRTTANGQTEDSKAKRLLFNVFNPELRPMLKVDTTGNWNYSVASWRQARGAADNQVEYLHGLAGRRVAASVVGNVYNSTTTVRNAAVGVGIDSATVDVSQRRTGAVIVNRFSPAIAEYNGYPGLGYHSLKWLEMGAGADVQTWVGDQDEIGYFQSGISAETLL